MTQTHHVSFARNAVAIECADAEASALVNRLYGEMPVDDSIAARVRFRLWGSAEPDPFVLWRQDSLLYRGSCGATAAGVLLDRSLFHLADGSSGGLLLHAAAVAWDGVAVILPGGSGAGKTTLAAWLSSRSFRYLTDELVFIPDGSTRVEALRRPLNVKSSARRMVEELVRPTASGVLETPGGILMTPPHPTAGEPIGASVRLVVFPAYRAGADVEEESLSPARGALRLMECLVNARNLPRHGFSAATDLARSLPCYSLTYGAFDQIGSRIERWLDASR